MIKRIIFGGQTCYLLGLDVGDTGSYNSIAVLNVAGSWASKDELTYEAVFQVLDNVLLK